MIPGKAIARWLASSTLLTMRPAAKRMTRQVAKSGLSWEAPSASLGYPIEKNEVEQRDAWQ